MCSEKIRVKRGMMNFIRNFRRNRKAFNQQYMHAVHDHPETIEK